MMWVHGSIAHKRDETKDDGNKVLTLHFITTPLHSKATAESKRQTPSTLRNLATQNYKFISCWIQSHAVHLIFWHPI